MSEKHNDNTTVSPASARREEMKRKKGLLFRRRLTVAILLLVAILAGVIYALVSSYVSSLPISFTDPNDGKAYEIRKQNGVYSLYTTDGDMCDITDDGYFITEYGTLVYVSPKSGEYSVDSGRELIYDKLEYNAYTSTGAFLSGCNEKNTIKRIDIYNDEGHYAFVRDALNSFFIEGREQVAFEQETFAQIAVSCGYTLSLLKLESPKLTEDGKIDYSEYGLVSETRTRTEINDKGEQIEVEYTYTPARYTVTTVSGDEYTVHIGDLTVTTNAYYARYESDEKTGVYVLSKTGREYITKGVEAVATPQLVYKVGEIEYVDVSDFIIRQDIDYMAIHKGLAERFGDKYDFGSLSDAEKEEYRRLYDQLLEANSKKLCHLSYQDLEERRGSIYSSVPYISYLELEKGYYVDSTNVSNMLGKIYDTDFEGVLKLSPTEEELNDYGVAYPESIITFYYVQYDDKGEEQLIYNQIQISRQLDNGTYNAYSSSYDMIVNISNGCFDFLKWTDEDWYDTSYVQHSISNITNIKLESSNTSIDFVFDDSQTLAGNITPTLGTSFKDSKGFSYETKRFDGGYKLTCAGEALISSMKSDLLVTATPYTKLTPGQQGFLFGEATSSDSNGDGAADIYIYYYYYVMYSGGEYILAASTETRLPDGTLVSQGMTVEGKPTMTTEYFVTDTLTKYVYYTKRDSALGKNIDALYTQHPNYTSDKVRLGGMWHTGSVFLTAKGAYVIVDAQSGECAKVTDVCNGLHIADRLTSKLASSAYISDSRTDWPHERFYPLKDGTLSYNYDTRKLEFYDRITKTKRNTVTSDCAPGIWCDGDIYALRSGQLVTVDSDGAIRQIILDESTEFIATVYANSTALDYLLYTTTSTGASKTVTATANFQQFYLGLLTASFEGVCELTEDEMAALRELDGFTEGGENNPCMLRLTVSAKDFKGNEHHVVYRFYRISERRAYITLEWLDSEGAPSSSENATGSFYVLASFVDKLISDANKVVSGELVDTSTKY